MDYIYSLANASLTLRAIEYLQQMEHLPVSSMTVIHQIDGWIVRIKFSQSLLPATHSDFCAFMKELGIACDLEMRIKMVLWSLDNQQSPTEVMRRYQVAIVSHGHPDKKDIEAFCQQFTRGLGYCPETLV
jgi:hypothetical protein